MVVMSTLRDSTLRPRPKAPRRSRRHFSGGTGSVARDDDK